MQNISYIYKREKMKNQINTHSVIINENLKTGGSKFLSKKVPCEAVINDIMHDISNIK